MRTENMTTADIYIHLANLALQIEKQIRAPGQAPSNRAHLRHTHTKITDAMSAMGLVNHSHAVAARQPVTL